MNIFIDSDVVISSLLSSHGAAYQLFDQKHSELSFFVSNISQRELDIVINKLKIDETSLKLLIEQSLTIVHLTDTIEAIKTSYKEYVKDINDAHIVAGSHKAQVRFLITYNMKDFKVEKIKRDLDISILSPGIFLQYLRSIKI